MKTKGRRGNSKTPSVTQEEEGKSSKAEQPAATPQNSRLTITLSDPAGAFSGHGLDGLPATYDVPDIDEASKPPEKSRH